MVLGVAFSNWVGTYDAVYFPAVEVGKPTPVTGAFILTGWLLAIALAVNVSATALAVLHIMTLSKRLARTARGLILALISALSIGVAVPVSIATSVFLGVFAGVGALCLIPLLLAPSEEPGELIPKPQA